ncbi:MAG: helix-turn-helix transcriptional regulator [Candidatus Limnocylindria bacterium]
MRLASVADVAAITRGRRLDLDWSQDDLARRAGTSRKLVNELEGGRSTPRLTHLLAIFDALGLTLEAVQSDDQLHEVKVDLDDVLKEYERG